MSKIVLCIVSLSIAALLFGAVALEAAPVSSAAVQVPFAFHVQNQHKVLSPGQYRIERTVGSPLTWLINMKTGERVMFLNPVNASEGNAPQFTKDAAGMSLRAIG